MKPSRGIPGILKSTTATAFLLITGCAGFESRPIAPAPDSVPMDAKSAANDGIVYYMPRKPIIVQVSLDEKGAMTISVPSSSAIPDRSRPYMLTVPPNGISESHATIALGSNGLLQSAATVQTSGTEALAKAIGTDLGTISAFTAGVARSATTRAAPPAALCANAQTYSLVIWPEEFASSFIIPGTSVGSICNLPVRLTNLGGHSLLADTRKASDYATAHSGVFYKSEIPYLVTIELSATQTQAFIAYSPDEAPTLFLPLKKSVFASNTTTFTLTDGVLIKSESDVGGEITGLAALPADIISAYMTALGDVFTSLNKNNSENTSLAISNALLHACQAAIRANPIQGVSASQAAINSAAIKSACGS